MEIQSIEDPTRMGLWNVIKTRKTRRIETTNDRTYTYVHMKMYIISSATTYIFYGKTFDLN